MAWCLPPSGPATTRRFRGGSNCPPPPLFPSLVTWLLDVPGNKIATVWGRGEDPTACLYGPHGHGECLVGLLLLELGERLGLQLPGGGARLPMRAGAPVEAPKVSMPSEFSNISWMSGGIDPGISIFNVITLSAPMEARQDSSHHAGQNLITTFLCQDI